jgi:dimethylamine monooxygenase subunit A
MLRYFPFTENFDFKIGTSPLPDPDRLIECDEHYLDEVMIRRNLLQAAPDYYFKAAPGTETHQWEVLENGDEYTWKNNLLQETHVFHLGNADTLPLAPLDWVGRQVQEDLLILSDKMILVAGSLCFPSGWDLDGKLDKHFFGIHAPLPSLTNSMIETANKFIERIPIGKAFQRNNWGFRITDQLDLSARNTEDYLRQLAKVSSEMNEKNAGEKVVVRVEHQTLSRLPRSGFVLFTIHTYQNKLEEEIKDTLRRKTIHSFLASVPEKLLEYKLMTPFISTLLSYLKNKSTD